MGTARLVLLIGRYAIKFPRLRIRGAIHYRRWQELLEGCRANITERRRWKQAPDPRLCPILWSTPLGLVVVMPYARPLTDDELTELIRLDAAEAVSMFNRVYSGDLKRENYGVLGGRIVKIDYEDLR